MELNNEIKELFDKFKGGAYHYNSNEENITLEVGNYHNPETIMICVENGDDMAMIKFISEHHDTPYLLLINETTKYEMTDGYSFLLNEKVHEEVQNLIIKVKHHFEENGFNEEMYDDAMYNNYNDKEMSMKRLKEHGIDADFESGQIFLDNMQRIISHEEAKLFWID